MSTPVPLRSDFDTIGLRMLARRSRDPDQTRRLLALAEIYDGGSRPDAARIGGVGGQIVRDWGVRFNAKGPDGLFTGKAPGAPSILDERQRQALRQVVEDGPIPALHGVVRWRLIDLAQWLFEEFRVSVSKPTLSRELRHMGFRKLSARPRHHAQDEEAAAAFKKTFSPSWRRKAQKKRSWKTRESFGLKTKLGSERKTRSPADGRNAGHGLRRRTTRGRVRPIFSPPSARPKEKEPGSYYPPATVKPWPFIWRKSRLRSRPARTPSFFLIRRDGMSRRGFQSQTTSRSCRCRRNRPSSIRSRPSGKRAIAACVTGEARRGIKVRYYTIRRRNG